MRLRSPLSSVPAVRADGQAADTDFQLDSWLRALRDLGDDRGWQRPGIGKIRVDRALNRACRVVGMVTLCTPNGFGDLILNLKDPSGTIDASVHKKVLSNENLSKMLSVGSVIFLKQVAVLRPSKTVCYLNVTQNNVEKVLQKDSVFPCKQVVSSNSDRQSQQPGQGENIMEREAGAETSDGMTATLNNISRTQESRMVELLADNGGSAKAVSGSILRANKDTHVVQNHQNKLLKQMDSSSQIQNLPGFNSSQQLKQGGSIAKYGISREAQSSTEDIMRKLMGGETMTPSSKEMTVAEGSRHNRGTPYASMYADARCNSEKPQEIGLQKMVEGHTHEHVSHSNRDEHHQQNLSANTRCSQPILGESSIICPRRDSTQASCTGNLRQLSDNELMQPSRKKQKSDAILSDGNSASMNSNSNTVSMDSETKHGIENSLNIGLDDITDGFHADHSSTRKFEHQRKDLLAASAGTVQPTQEDCSISATSGTLLSKHKVVSMAPVAEWTDEQLSELFADY